jgi:hypothetical protein
MPKSQPKKGDKDQAAVSVRVGTADFPSKTKKK